LAGVLSVCCFMRALPMLADDAPAAGVSKKKMCAGWTFLSSGKEPRDLGESCNL